MTAPALQPDPPPLPWRRRAVAVLRQPRVLAVLIPSLIWLFFVLEWLWAHYVADGLRWIVFSLGCIAAVAMVLLAWTRSYPQRVQAIVASLAVVVIWPLPVFIADYFAAGDLARTFANVGMGIVFLMGLAWTVWGVERGSRYYLAQRQSYAPHAASLSDDDELAPSALALNAGAAALPAPSDIWNPVDLEAWYYGRKKAKLNQSVTTILLYTLAFFLLVLIVNRLGGCEEIYEMPAGGGEEKPKVQVVKIQKVIRRKFVINPFSAVVFNPPPIEEVQLNLQELTKHEYQIGQGKGTGAGFSGGTNRGKVRFIRLEYRGGDWDQDFGVGADLNMLLRYGVETGHSVAEKTESRTIEELGRFAMGKSPPMVYMTGERSIDLSKREVEILREYLLDKHGMIFGDNGGSGQFHGQFFSMMNKVLDGTGVYPVKVPLDDVIHRIPFTLPFLPYVAPHGGKEAWGWYKDGRWLAYYHPGDIGDAWADGHAGVKREIYEACYQLGVNVIFYAHAEYNKWLDTREKKP
jgi:hypothetical protein